MQNPFTGTDFKNQILTREKILHKQAPKKITTESIPTTYEKFKIEKVKEILGKEEFRYISSYIDMNLESTKILMPESQQLVHNLWPNNYSNFVSVGRINDIRYLSKFFKSVNNVIPINGMYAGFVETDNQRAHRILNKYPKAFAYPYYVFDFILNQIFPKWKITKKICYLFTHKNNRILSVAEIFGKLVVCGFKIIDCREINNLIYFVVKKVELPLKIKRNTHKPYVIIAKYDQSGKPIQEFKLNSKNLYVEYFQKYIYNDNRLAKDGKFLNILVQESRISKLHWRILKRLFESIFTILLIIFIFSWLIPLIAICIKIISPGPIIYKQERWGKNNRKFIMYKFRSMINNSMEIDRNGNYKETSKNDSRVTRIGKFLRKTNLDELPQFINVLKGEMSIVGPRPHPEILNLESKKNVNSYMIRHCVKPGLTGWAQVNGYRGATNGSHLMQERVNHDVYYINNWSFTFDIKIILITIWNMIKGDPYAY